MKLSKIKRNEIALGFEDGRVYIFDQNNRMSYSMIKHNVGESIGIRKSEKLLFIRHVSTDKDLILALYEDCCYYVFNNKIQNTKVYNINTATELILKMRRVEETRVVSTMTHNILEKNMKFADDASVKFFVSMTGVPIIDHCSAINLTNIFNPMQITQFYFRKIHDIQFCPVTTREGKTIFALSADSKYLQIFDFHEIKIIFDFKTDYGQFNCLQFSYNGHILAGGCANNEIFIFDVDNFILICKCVGFKSSPTLLRFDKYFTKKCFDFFDKNMEYINSLKDDQPYNHIKSKDILSKVSLEFNPNPETNYSITYLLIGIGEDNICHFWIIDYIEILSYKQKEESYINDKFANGRINKIKKFKPVNVYPINSVLICINKLVSIETIYSNLIFVTKNIDIFMFKPKYQKVIDDFQYDYAPHSVLSNTKERKEEFTFYMNDRIYIIGEQGNIICVGEYVKVTPDDKDKIKNYIPDPRNIMNDETFNLKQFFIDEDNKTYRLLNGRYVSTFDKLLQTEKIEILNQIKEETKKQDIKSLDMKKISDNFFNKLNSNFKLFRSLADLKKQLLVINQDSLPPLKEKKTEEDEGNSTNNQDSVLQSNTFTKNKKNVKLPNISVKKNIHFNRNKMPDSNNHVSFNSVNSFNNKEKLNNLDNIVSKTDIKSLDKSNRRNFSPKFESPDGLLSYQKSKEIQEFVKKYDRPFIFLKSTESKNVLSKYTIKKLEIPKKHNLRNSNFPTKPFHSINNVYNSK